jgi:hypothetical protein
MPPRNQARDRALFRALYPRPKTPRLYGPLGKKGENVVASAALIESVKVLRSDPLGRKGLFLFYREPEGVNQGSKKESCQYCETISPASVPVPTYPGGKVGRPPVISREVC